MRYIQVYPQAPKIARLHEFIANSDEEAKAIALENFRKSVYTASTLYPYGQTGLMSCIRTFTITDLDIDTEDYEV